MLSEQCQDGSRALDGAAQKICCDSKLSLLSSQHNTTLKLTSKRHQTPDFYTTFIPQYSSNHACFRQALHLPSMSLHVSPVPAPALTDTDKSCRATHARLPFGLWQRQTASSLRRSRPCHLRALTQTTFSSITSARSQPSSALMATF